MLSKIGLRFGIDLGDSKIERIAFEPAGRERLRQRIPTPHNDYPADPDVIVLCGGLSNLDRLYESVPRLWSPYVFSDRVHRRLARNAHGDSSGVRGAAWLWDRPGN